MGQEDTSAMLADGEATAAPDVTAEPSLDDLQTRIKALEQETQGWQKKYQESRQEAVGHQRANTRLQGQLKRLEAQAEDIRVLKEELLGVSQRLEGDGAVSEKTPHQRLQERLARAQVKTEPDLPESAQEASANITAMLSEAGVDVKNMPEELEDAFDSVRLKWNLGDYVGAERKARKALDTWKASKETKEAPMSDITNKTAPKADKTAEEKARIAAALTTDRRAPAGGAAPRRYTAADVKNFSPEGKTVAQMREETDAMVAQLRGRR